MTGRHQYPTGPWPPGRYPIGDLIALLRLPPLALEDRHHTTSDRPTLSEARKLLSISDTAFERYAREGLTVDQAERLAMRARRHPYTIWPRMSIDIINGEGALTCDRCGHPFYSDRRGARYCHTRCRDIASSRRQRDRANTAA